MFRRRSDSRHSPRLSSRATVGTPNRNRRNSPAGTAPLQKAVSVVVETMEERVLLSAAFDVTSLTAMRQDPNFSSITGSGIGIAVLDSGAFAQNPDLKANVKAFYNAVLQPPTAAVDPNFLADAVDNVGHGSHVSGIAASSNPDIGVAYNASLIDIKVIPDTNLGEVAQAGDPLDNGLQWVILHAAKYNIKVVNMSLGFETNVNSQPALDTYGRDIQTLESQGITVVAASGNDYADFLTPGEDQLAAEATIGVANTWPDNGAGHYNFTAYYGEQNASAFAGETVGTPDALQATSQRSSLFNQVAAPGTGIFSTWNSPTQLHNTISGTSMSAPFVSGVVALMQQTAQKYGGQYLTPQTALQILRNTSDVFTDTSIPTNSVVTVQPDGTLSSPSPEPGTGITYDRINVLRAMQAVKTLVQGGATPTDSNHSIATAVTQTPLNGKNTDIIQGTIGTDGSTTIGNGDVDIYKIVVQTPGDLTITSQAPVGGVQFNEALTLFDASGNVVYRAPGGNGTPYPTILSDIGVPLQAGTYYLGVSSSGNVYNPTSGVVTTPGSSSGDYLINMTVASPDPGGEPAAAESLSLTSPNTVAIPLSTNLDNLPYSQQSATLGIETLENGSTVNITDGDVHFYSVVAPDTGNVLVQGTDNNGVIFLKAFDANGAPVGTTGASISFPVTAGQIYYIAVTNLFNQNFQPNDPFTRVQNSTVSLDPFTIFTAFDNGDRNGTVGQATAETVGSTVTGTIGSDPAATFLGANGGNKDVDFYTFTAANSGVFQATVVGAGGLTPQISLWRTESGISSVTKLLNTSGTVYEEVTAGETVFVAITGTGNQSFNGISLASGGGGTVGTYTLNTSVQSPTILSTLANNSIVGSTPTPLTLGSAANGNIGLDGSLFIGAGDVDFYSFTAPTSRLYTFSTSTSQDNSADTVMRIFDSLGNQIAVNDNASDSTTASSIAVSMTAGQQFFIGITGAGAGALAYDPLNGVGSLPGSTGNYSIQVNDTGAYQRDVAFDESHNLVFTDKIGHKITIRMTGPGAAEALFFSVSGNDNIGELKFTGTDASTKVTVNGSTTIGQILITNGIGTFNGSQVKLAGNFSDAGALKTLNLASVTSGAITIGAGPASTITIPSLTNVSLTSSSVIKMIRVNQWTTNATPRLTLSAPSIQSLQVRGSFNEDVSATTIKKFTVGSLTASAIRASSSIETLTAGSATGSEIFAGITPTTNGLPTSASQFTAGRIKTLTVRGGFSSTQIAAFNIDKVTINALNPNNGGKAFGIATHKINKGRIIVDGTPHVLSNLFSPLDQQRLGNGDAVIDFFG